MDYINSLLLNKLKYINKSYLNRISIDLESIEDEEFSVEVTETKDKMKTLKLIKEDKEVFLFSKYSVKKEIGRFLSEIKDINTKSMIVVFGFGLGYHIAKLFEKLSIDNEVLIIEPSVKIFFKAIETINIEEIFEDGISFNIVVGNNIKKINDYFYKKINMDNLNNVYFCIFGQYGSIFDTYVNKTFKKLKDRIINEEVNLATEYHFQYEFSGNLIKNIPYLLESKSISELKEKFNEYPAIIVSAGPSLDKNIHKLKKAQGKAVIISGGRTLKPLLENGIKPNFVVSVDPGYPAYKLLENYLNCEIPLISMVLSNNDIIKKYKGKHFIINKNPYCEFIKELTEKDIPILPNGGSVAHISTVIGNYMGCNPIILVGQDLAFTNQKMHSDQAIIEGQRNEKKEGNILVEDIYGKKVYTSKPLFSFLKWFEKYFSINKCIKFIDSTEGGAKIKGTEIATLEETIDKYCKNILPEYQELMVNSKVSYELYKKPIKFMLEICNNLDQMETLIGRGLELIKKADRYYKTNENINITKIIKQLASIDNKILRMSNSSVLLTSVVIPDIRKISLDKDLLEKFGETESEKGSRIVKKSKILYIGMLKSINLMKPLIKEAINVMKEKADK